MLHHHLLLGAELARVALRGLNRLRRKQELDQEEEYAVERLCSWLARVQGADPLLDAALDDAQREFLLSYRLPEGGGDAAAPGAPAAAPQRQFILPQRASRSGSAGASAGSAAAAADGSNGNGCDACATLAGDVSRASSEEVEAGVNDPELQEVLRTLEEWDRFDVFRVAQLTDGRPLQTVALALLRKRGLVQRLCLPEDRLRSFLADVEAAYHPHNPYHNSLHAADVTQALGAMLAADAFSRQLSDLEQLAVILAAVVHDVGHPGVNNDFLIRTQSEAAVAYNDQSINENMHAAAGFKLLAKKENNFLCGLPADDFRAVRRLVIRIILATDMARHHESVEEFTACLQLWGPDLSTWAPDKRAIALQLLVHAADISNPARPLRFCSRWGQKVHEEFFAQGDKEAALGLPVSFICDRSRSSVPQSQLTFVEYVVKPCFSMLAAFAPNFVACTQPHIDAALQHWQQQAQQQRPDAAAAAEASEPPADAAAAALAAASISPPPAAADGDS